MTLVPPSTSMKTLNSFSQGRSPDTGSPGPRSSGRSWLPSLSGTLNAYPTCFCITNCQSQTPKVAPNY